MNLTLKERDNCITVVAGIGRCGSSLLMKMLLHGGLPVFVDPKFHPYYESSLQMTLPTNYSWLNECKGAAVKVLFPFCLDLPKGFSYKFVWITRNPIEQSKSLLKVARLSGDAFLKANNKNINFGEKLDIDSCSLNPYEIKMASRSALQTLKSHNMPILIVSFEDLISQPMETAILISNFLPEYNLNINEMTKSVVPRPVSNLNGFLENNIGHMIHKTVRLMQKYMC